MTWPDGPRRGFAQGGARLYGAAHDPAPDRRPSAQPRRRRSAPPHRTRRRPDRGSYPGRGGGADELGGRPAEPARHRDGPVRLRPYRYFRSDRAHRAAAPRRPLLLRPPGRGDAAQEGDGDARGQKVAAVTYRDLRAGRRGGSALRVTEATAQRSPSTIRVLNRSSVRAPLVSRPRARAQGRFGQGPIVATRYHCRPMPRI